MYDTRHKYYLTDLWNKIWQLTERNILAVRSNGQ